MKGPDFKTLVMVCVLLFRRGGDDEEFNPAPKVDRAPQGTNPNSPGDHWFWR